MPGKYGKDGKDGKDGNDAPVIEYNQIVAASWMHNRTLAKAGTDITTLFTKTGIAVGFREPVAVEGFVNDTSQSDQQGEGISFVFELLRRHTATASDNNHPLDCWCTVSQIVCQGLGSFDTGDGDTLIQVTDADPSANLVIGARLIFDREQFASLSARPGEMFRVRARSEFFVGENGLPVDGDHVAGKLPTGTAGSGGGIFESWFFV